MRLQANRRPQPLVICNEGRHRDLRAARGDSGPVCAAVSVRRSCCTRPVPWGRRARPVESARHQGE